MPYSVKGNIVYKQGKPWRKAKNHEKALAMVRAIMASEYGRKPKK